MDTREIKTQKDVINLLKNMGYTYISPEDINKYKDREKDVILKKILKESLSRINTFIYRGEEFKFSERNINLAIDKIESIDGDSKVIINENIHRSLNLGESFKEEEQTGVGQSFSMKYIDFKNIENNVFHVTEEFIVQRVNQDEREKTRRPDLVLFVNGIPLGVIELKSALVSIKEGISQMIRNQGKDEIPDLFKYSQILLAGNASSYRYGTTETPEKFWSIWKEEDKKFEVPPVGDRLITEIDKGVFSFFEKNRFLEIIRNYIIYDKNVKKVARYQQYFAIKEILKKIKTFDNENKRGGGLIWHTQGSGKSLTMVMLAMAIKREVSGAKIVVVTDRKELDKQISKTFAYCDFGDVSNAESGRDLLLKIKQGKTMITTIINKFVTVRREKEEIKDNNVFLLVDEAHRSQSSDLHAAMKKVFPKGCYLGFTGTPLLKSEKSSFQKFGGLIHAYKIDEAVKDKAVLPLLYEGRLVDQWINDEKGMERKFELICKGLNEEQKKSLEEKWARFQKVASSEKRLEVIAMDINEHFKNNFKNTGFKGMIIAERKYPAVKYHEIFEEYGDVKTAFILSKEDTREGHEVVDGENKNYVAKKIAEKVKEFGSYEAYESWAIDEFLNGDEIDILIVADKLITGFDAPKAAVLYIDKQMKEHKLLQAIARVNRLATGKEFGYVLDYRGLLGNLDQALTSYTSLDGFDEDDLIGTVIDIKNEIAKIKTNYSHLTDLFKSIKNKEFEDFCVFLEDEKLREKFYLLFKEFSKSLKLVMGSEKTYEIISDEEMTKYKKDAAFYNKLRKAVRLRYYEDIDFGEYEGQMQKLLDTYISSGETNQLTKLMNIFHEDFDKEVSRLGGSRAKADTIRNALTKTIVEKREDNPVFYDSLVEKINKVLEEYKNKRISEEEYLSSIKEIRTLLANEETSLQNSYPEELKNSGLGKALYDNVGEVFLESLDNKEKLVEFVVECTELLLEKSKKPDWETNLDVHNEIELEIEDKLWDLQNSEGIKFEIGESTRIIMSIGKSRLAKKG